MPCALDNRTPLPAKVQEQTLTDGRPGVLVVAKATWRLDTGRLASAEQQQGMRTLPLRLPLGALELDQAQRRAIERRADEEIIWLDHDLSPPKPRFDIVLAGYATRRLKAGERNNPPPFFDAGFALGKQIFVLRAHPPRYWERDRSTFRACALATHAERVPISYALADWDAGFPLRANEGERQWLPWIEAPDHASQALRHAAEAAGFGYWPESAAHRRRYMGTFDDAWKKERAPALPRDFDPRFFNVAHPALQLERPPPAGEPLRLVNLCEQAVLDTHTPALALNVVACTAGGATLPAQPLRADTLTLEPDQNRMALTFRALLPDAGGPAALRNVVLFRQEEPA